MSEELDRRSALAMGWTWGLVGYDSCWHKDGNFKRLGSSWSPSTDRNDLAELLREVERRGIVATYNMSTRVRDLWSADESILANQYFFALTADPAVICEAACKVLEEE